MYIFECLYGHETVYIKVPAESLDIAVAQMKLYRTDVVILSVYAHCKDF